MSSHRGTGQEARVSLHHFHKPNINSCLPPYSSCPSVASPTLQQNCLHILKHLGISKAMHAGKQTLPIESPLALAMAHFCFAERYKLCCLSQAWWEHVYILKSSGASHFPWVLPWKARFPPIAFLCFTRLPLWVLCWGSRGEISFPKRIKSIKDVEESLLMLFRGSGKIHSSADGASEHSPPNLYYYSFTAREFNWSKQPNFWHKCLKLQICSDLEPTAKNPLKSLAGFALSFFREHVSALQ